jgi:hypothetical protein
MVTFLLLLGLISVGIGGWVVADSLWWRLFARRVTGVSIGLRERQVNAPMLDRLGLSALRSYPCTVYRYTDSTGRTVEAMSVHGAINAVEGKIVRLLVFKNRPDRVREIGGWIGELVGAMFLCLGLYLLHLISLDWSLHQIIAMLAGFGMIIVVGYWLITRSPSDGAGMPSGEDARPANGASAIRLIRTAHADAAPPLKRIQVVLIAVFGVGIMAAGIYKGYQMIRYEFAAQRATGTVVAVERETGDEADRTIEVVRFTTASRDQIKFRNHDFSKEIDDVGDAVPVLYFSETPDSAIIDRGPWMWLLIAAGELFGLTLVVVAIAPRK